MYIPLSGSSQPLPPVCLSSRRNRPPASSPTTSPTRSAWAWVVEWPLIHHWILIGNIIKYDMILIWIWYWYYNIEYGWIWIIENGWNWMTEWLTGWVANGGRLFEADVVRIVGVFVAISGCLWLVHHMGCSWFWPILGQALVQFRYIWKGVRDTYHGFSPGGTNSAYFAMWFSAGCFYFMQFSNRLVAWRLLTMFETIGEGPAPA